MTEESVRGIVREQFGYAAYPIISYAKELEETARNLSPEKGNVLLIAYTRKSFVASAKDDYRIPPNTRSVLEHFLNRQIPFSDVVIALTELRQTYERTFAEYGIEPKESEEQRIRREMGEKGFAVIK
jgi:hypothetical protein